MNVLILSPGQDTAGYGIRIKEAFDRHAPGWSVRSAHVANTYIKYPHDLMWPADEAEIRRLYDQADVVHHNNGLYFYGFLDGNQRKPTIHMHHGTRLRDHPALAFDEGISIGAVPLVSTVDLLDDAPGATWIPAPYDIEWLRTKYRVPSKGKVIRIGHAPTVRAAKNTHGIMRALEEVCRARVDVEVDLIEGVEWRVCLSRKGRCDIFIDQITLGYGCNGVEAMAMGIPVVSSFADGRDRQRFIDATGEHPPFMEATEETLAQNLLMLIRDAELREQLGALGQAFVEKWHDEANVVAMLKPIYENAPQTKGERFLRRFNERTGRVMEREAVPA